MRSLFLFLGLSSFNLFAQDRISIPHMVNTECMSCHANQNLDPAPMISGQKQDFLEFELFNFRDYERDHEIMNQVMEVFSDSEVREIAAYISSLPLCHAQARVDDHFNANIVNGETIFQSSCFECHKKDKSGIGPIIHGQKTVYLEDAIKSFQSTWYEPRPSRINMREHTDMLSEQDIRDVAAYLNEQKLCSVPADLMRHSESD